MSKSCFNQWLSTAAGAGLCSLLIIALTGCSDASKKAESANKVEKPADNSWTNGMVWIPGGTFHMGSEGGQTDEKPVHQVTVDGFWIDQTEVTNEQFEKFIKATGYVTIAERKPDPKDFPGADPAMLVPGSIVFRPPGHEVSLDNTYEWWAYIPGRTGSILRGRPPIYKGGRNIRWCM